MHTCSKQTKRLNIIESISKISPKSRLRVASSILSGVQTRPGELVKLNTAGRAKEVVVTPQKQQQSQASVSEVTDLQKDLNLSDVSVKSGVFRS